MSDVLLLEGFNLEPAKIGLAVYLKGDARYVDVVQAAFKEARWYGRYEVFSRLYDHLLYAHGVGKPALEKFLEFCKTTLYLTTTLDECWAIERHTLANVHSELGKLVYRAKTYKESLDLQGP